MTLSLKRIIKRAPIYHPLRTLWVKRGQARELREWESRGGTEAPVPHIVKQRALAFYARKFGLRILVETGTYRGDMVASMRNIFDSIYSVELSRELYDEASIRFRREKSITLIHGDSGKEMAGLLSRFDQPALFWLDGHYSAGVTAKGEKETPIVEELRSILSDKRDHVILIDDARCFGADPSYPTLRELETTVDRSGRPRTIEIRDDMIRVCPVAS